MFINLQHFHSNYVMEQEEKHVISLLSSVSLLCLFHTPFFNVTFFPLYCCLPPSLPLSLSDTHTLQQFNFITLWSRWKQIPMTQSSAQEPHVLPRALALHGPCAGQALEHLLQHIHRHTRAFSTHTYTKHTHIVTQFACLHLH